MNSAVLDAPDTLNPTSVRSAQSSVALAPFNLSPFSSNGLDHYIRTVNSIPLLTCEEEADLASRLKESSDLGAARRLVLSHLRLVVSIARSYLGYGLPHADLIQEGNIGLMKAVKRFDPSRGARLVTFATHWIKAEIHEFILNNWRQVKIATTKAQRKLFFNLRRMRSGSGALPSQEADEIAQTLGVKQGEVREMQMRMRGNAEVSLDPLPSSADEEYTPISYLVATDPFCNPEKLIELKEKKYLETEGLHKALASLDERSQRIINKRWLKQDNEPTATLHDLAAEFGVSAERIRQIEARALQKMRTFLSAP